MAWGYNTYYSDYCHKRTALYRMYSADEELLYVGITVNIEGRLSQHRRREWYPDVADITVQWFPNREDAKAAERAAISDENPLHNVTRPRTQEWREIV